MKLDQATILNRLGWRPLEGLPQEKARTTRDYKGILCGFDRRLVEEKLEMVVNQKLTLQLDCTIEPRESYYHAMLAVNPLLLAAAEVSAPTIFIAGEGRIQPVIHVRALRSIDLRDLKWVASIHLVD